MRNHRSPLVFFAALLLLFSVASCKKEEDPNAAGASFALEKLGDLTLDNGELGFNLAGEPLIQVKSNVYEWSNTSKAWRRIGGEVSARTLNNGAKQYAQDKRGVYYTCDGDFINSCATPTDTWQKVSLPGIVYGVSPTYLVANDLGDIVVMTRDDADVMRYFLKKGTAAVWTPLTSMPRTSFTNEAPIFLCNNGILYLGGGLYPRDIAVADKYLDTNTGRYARLFDKADPANVRLAGTGLMNAPAMQIHSSGAIYLWEGKDLFKFDGATPGAKITKIRTFENPLIGKHDVSWTNRFSSFSMTEAGDIKVMGVCGNNYRTHFSYITGNSGKSGMQLLQDEVMTQPGMLTNRKNEGFILMYPNTGLYKWN